MCAAATTPTLDGYTDLGTMIDERDGKKYAVRKYSDGHCWLAQNLAFGTISSNTNYQTYSQTTALGILGTGLYGVAGSPGGNYEGYLYDWQAVIQRSDAYDGKAYSGPTSGVQGICPTGWHIPTSGTNGEIQTLLNTVGSNYISFFFGGNFCASGSKCIAGSFYGYNGSPVRQGTNFYIWSSNPDASRNTTHSHNLDANASNVRPADSSRRYYGCSVRCLADY